MKSLIAAIAISVISVPCSANIFDSLMFQSREAAYSQALFEVDSISAFQVINGKEEVEVSILSEDGVQIDYGCHVHGDHTDCHEEGHKNNELESDLLLGEKAALAKIETTLSRRGFSSDAIESYKVWSEREDHDHEADHHHGENIWSKFSLNLKGKKMTRYVLCHEHGADEGFVCHFSLTGKDEPSFGEE